MLEWESLSKKKEKKEMPKPEKHRLNLPPDITGKHEPSHLSLCPSRPFSPGRSTGYIPSAGLIYRRTRAARQAKLDS